MRHIRRNLKAISPVLAVLMMIAVAIAGSLVVYAWVMGYIGLSNEKAGQQITVQSIANEAVDVFDPEDPADLYVYVQNTGQSVVQLDEEACLYVNGQLVPVDITGVTVSDHIASLGQGETATLTYVDGGALPGVKIEVKVTPLGGGAPAEASEYPAGITQATPALDHFEFATIGTQISTVGFNITIRAIDQYGQLYTGYIGTNELTYSAGDITPLATGGFDDGTWTGTVNVTGEAEDATISTIDSSEGIYTGISNAFDVDAVVTFVSAGTGGVYIPGATPAVDTTPTYPSGLEEDDLILLQIGIRDATTVPDTPAGFTILYGPESAGESTTYGRQWIFYKFSDGNEAGALTITWGTASPTNVISQMFAFRYVDADTVTEGKTVGTQDNDIVYAENVTTAGPRRLAVAFVYATDNPTIGSFTGESGGNWALPSGDSYTMGEGAETHEDSYIVLQTATMLQSGTISDGSFAREGVHTDPGDNSWCIIAFALQPSD